MHSKEKQPFGLWLTFGGSIDRKETGIYMRERSIDAGKEPTWQEVGLRWISDAIEPDKTSGRATRLLA